MVIEVEGIYKSFGDTKAVNGISFEVRKGEIFGMIGPNGAGKTTTIECIEGLKKPDSGRISVLGLDPWKDRKKLYNKIGVQLQETSYPDNLKVNEICKLFSSFYSNPVPYEELLKKFDLYEKKNAYISKMSGGQKQKLAIILALIARPEIVFLDELTTGLDPHARRSMWGLVKELKNEGMTVYMTTHYMQEAEFLCDRLAIVDKGQIIAMDTMENIFSKYAGDEVISFNAQMSDADVEEIKKISCVNNAEIKNDEITVYAQGTNCVSEIVMFLQNKSIGYKNLRTRSANLEDIFLKLTGRNISFEEEQK